MSHVILRKGSISPCSRTCAHERHPAWRRSRSGGVGRDGAAAPCRRRRRLPSGCAHRVIDGAGQADRQVLAKHQLQVLAQQHIHHHAHALRQRCRPGRRGRQEGRERQAGRRPVALAQGRALAASRPSQGRCAVPAAARAHGQQSPPGQARCSAGNCASTSLHTLKVRSMAVRPRLDRKRPTSTASTVERPPYLRRRPCCPRPFPGLPVSLPSAGLQGRRPARGSVAHMLASISTCLGWLRLPTQPCRALNATHPCRRLQPLQLLRPPRGCCCRAPPSWRPWP